MSSDRTTEKKLSDKIDLLDCQDIEFEQKLDSIFSSSSARPANRKCVGLLGTNLLDSQQKGQVLRWARTSAFSLVFLVNSLSPSDLAIQSGSVLERPKIFYAELNLDEIFSGSEDFEVIRKFRAFKLLFGPAFNYQSFFSNSMHSHSNGHNLEGFCEAISSRMFAGTNSEHIRQIVGCIMEWRADPNQGILQLFCHATILAVEKTDYEEDISFFTFVTETSSSQFCSQRMRIHCWLQLLVSTAALR